ncbi:MAG TPA: hypothetical protein VNQ31_01850 [Sphingomonadaceae bacterium]|nr:hypothetical protein [Sphingomonadaceae bacterium]
MSWPWRAALPVLFCLAPLAAACGSRTAGELPGNAAYSVESGGDGNATIVRTTAGKAVISDGETAAALPAGLALFPGATVTASSVVTDERATGDGEPGGGESALLSFTSAASPAAIAGFYKAAALRAGYRIDGEMTTGGIAMLSAARPGAGGFTLTASPGANGSEATLIAGRE